MSYITINEAEVKEANGVRRISRNYATLLLLIFLSLFGFYVVSDYAFHHGNSESALINASSRQCMLNQRILYLALEHRSNPTPDSRRLLADAVDRFERSHRNLVSHAGDSEVLRLVYFEPDRFGMTLHDLSLDYVASARLLVDGEREGYDAALAVIQTYGSDSLLTRLDGAMLAFESNAELRAATLRKLQGYSLLAALLMLIVAALFIFLPDYKTLDQLLDRMKTFKTKLESQDRRLSEMRRIGEYKANHDELTGLLNRQGLIGVLETLMEQCKGLDDTIALLHIDLDRFKPINDTLGHAAGDHILCAVADRLRARTGSRDSIARVGGDEFVVLSVGAANEEALRDKAQQLIDTLSRPVTYKDAVCRFGASMGIATATATARDNAAPGDADQMLVNADIALSCAKGEGDGCFAFYTPELHVRISESQQFSDAILDGLADGQFVAFYQLQVAAGTHKIIGLEALVRWQHPTKGILAPAHFLEAAASLDVLSHIDEQMMAMAARDINTWRSMGLVPPRVAINLSAQRLADAQFWPSLLALDLSTADIAFEITESVRLDDPTDQAVTNVLRLKAAGFDLEIDDFGTGYASLLSVQTIMPKRVKIAREIVDPIVRSQAQRDVLRGICAIASAYGCEVVAEGIETRQHALIAEQLGSDVLQGYHFNQPSSVEDIATMLRDDGLVGDIEVISDGTSNG